MISRIAFALAVLFSAPRAARAQICAIPSVALIVLDSAGVPLDSAGLAEFLPRLPAVGGSGPAAIAPVLRSPSPGSARATASALIFGHSCLLDLRELTLERGSTRMRLIFDLALFSGGPLQAVTVESPPFANGAFVLDRSRVTADRFLSSSAWDRTTDAAHPPGVLPDCAATARTTSGELFALRMHPMSSSQRHTCLARIIPMLANLRNPVDAERAAIAIQSAAAAHLVDDAAVLRPLVACVQRDTATLGVYCNRALVQLTRRSIGEALYRRDRDAPPFTAAEHARVVADWNAVIGPAHPHPIYDAYVADEVARAVHAVAASLETSLAPLLPGHPVLGYLHQVAMIHPSVVSGNGETIFHWAMGNAGGRPILPGNWPRNGTLAGIRFMLSRPDIATARSTRAPNRDRDTFPASAADYRETFPALDLELRFQIVTPVDSIRVIARDAVHETLIGLRQADSIARRAGRALPLEAFRTRCDSIAGRPTAPGEWRDCRLTSVGRMGLVDGQRYAYAIYCLIPGDADSTNGSACGAETFNARYHSQRGTVVFVVDSARRSATPIFGQASDAGNSYYVTPPTIARAAAHTILYLPIALDGTGNYNVSEYYLRDGNRWRRIESESWQNGLTAKLPADVRIGKGIWPDPITLRATAGLYRRGDGNCCPSGGVAHIQLALRDGRFVLESVRAARR